MYQATTVGMKTYISLSADPTLIISSFKAYSVTFARFVDYKHVLFLIYSLPLVLVNYFAKFSAYSTNNP